MTGADGGFQRIHHFARRIVATAFECAKNRHQNGLRFRSRFALVALNHLAHNDLRLDIGRNVFDHAGTFGAFALARRDGPSAIRASLQRRMLYSIRDFRIFLTPASRIFLNESENRLFGQSPTPYRISWRIL